ncbi:MAG TPA: amidohydrolase family protein [Chloroflexota bacterium]
MTDRTLVLGRWVWVERDSGPELLEDHAVLVEGDRIAGVTPVAETVGWDTRRIEVADGLVLPGLINAHTHVGSSPPLRGIPEDLPSVGQGGSALFQVTSPVTDLLYSPEFASELAAFAAWDLLQLVRCGVTCVVNETVAGFDDYVAAALQAGVRTYVSPMFPAGNRARGFLRDGAVVYAASEGLQADLDQSLAYHARYHGRGEDRVRVKISPHAPDTVDPDTLRAVRAAASELGCPITIHAAQSRNEVNQVRQRYGRSSLAHLAALGFLGPDVLVTHATYPEDGDLAVLRDAGATVVHCPTRKAREAALSPYVPYLEAGVRTALGTDAYNMDLVEDMKLAATLGKISGGSVSRPTARDVVLSATRHAADALGRSDLGRIAAGARADLTVVRLDGPHHAPVLEPLRSLVYYSSGTDVDTVLVDGRILLHSGRLRLVDEATLRRAAEQAAQHLWRTARARGALQALAR